MDAGRGRVEGGALVDALVQLSFEVQAALARASGGHDLSVTQVRMLGVLRDREPGVGELATHLGLTASSATGLVDRAERRGLVVRTPRADDRRSVTVSLTALGREVAADVESRLAAEVEVVTRGLDDGEQGQLKALLHAVLQSRPEPS